MSRAIDQVQHCRDMAEVRQHIDALDRLLVPLLVTRGGYMTEAARIKQDRSEVRDEERIEDIVQKVRQLARDQGGDTEVIEAIYRAMMNVYIASEHREFDRLRRKEQP